MRCAALASCVAHDVPVEAVIGIAAADRTAAWTVLVSPRGVAEYLNKRISPVGAQVVPWRPCMACRPWPWPRPSP